MNWNKRVFFKNVTNDFTNKKKTKTEPLFQYFPIKVYPNRIGRRKRKKYSEYPDFTKSCIMRIHTQSTNTYKHLL